jgi:hypothetical protein
MAPAPQVRQAIRMRIVAGFAVVLVVAAVGDATIARSDAAPATPTPTITAGKGVVFGEVGANHSARSYSVVPGHAITITAKKGGATTRVKTDAKGQYSIELAPGTYTFTTTVPRIVRGLAGTTTASVEVVAGKRVEIDFKFSDGTRCLDRETPIATPDGDRAVHALQPGDAIWACGVDGRPVRDRVIATQAMDAPGLAVRLAVPGGELVIAPSHMLADGSLPGDASAERVRYSNARSYDVMTASGRPYWASGVAVWSTMQPAGPDVRCVEPVASP